MLSQINPALELHKRIMADLDRRDAAVVKQEADARRALEQAIADCAAQRARTDQERILLTQAGQLYQRFSEEEQLRLSATCSMVPLATLDAAPALVAQEHAAAPAPTEPDSAPAHTLVEPYIESEITTTIRGLRKQLSAEYKAAAAAAATA